MAGAGNKQKIVVKIGSSTLSAAGGNLDEAFLKEFIDGLSTLHNDGHSIAVVTSGAIRMGAPRLNMDRKNMNISQQQAAAAVGQGILISKYIDMFAANGIVAAQVLLTPDITNDRKTYLNVTNTLRTLMDMRAVPVINENDTVAYEEIKFGDNDTLSAITAIIIEADMLALLSDVEGLYRGDPSSEGAELIREVNEIGPEILALAGGPGKDGGFGGMATKISAAQAATNSGIRMVIANGRLPHVVERIAGGEKIGTEFIPVDSRLSGRKKWLAFGCRPEGAILVNEGAARAIATDGKSLLPSGVTGTYRSFEYGACVELRGPDGTPFARGLTNYSALEIEHIKGKHSSEIEVILSFRISDEVVHRDDLVLI